MPRLFSWLLQPSGHLSPFSMVYCLLVFALLLNCLAQVYSHPAAWFRKLSHSSRDDGNWLLGWAWASDGSVSIVDRSPALTYPARPASFGAELSDPLLGYVIPLSSFTTPCPAEVNATVRSTYTSDPTQGCPSLCVGGPHKPEMSETWIALVQRGGCPFVEKAREAQRLGAKALVVGGDRENPDALLNMYSEKDASDVHIPSTYIRYWDYVELSSLIASSNTSHNGLRTLSLLISTEYSAWEWYSPIITFIVILLLPSLLTFVTLLIHRVRAARAAQRDRAPEEFVHRLPWRVWTGTGWEKHEPSFPEPQLAQGAEEQPAAPSSEPDLEQGMGPRVADPSTSHDEAEQPSWVDQQMECAICLEMFAKGDRVRVLPCGHLFHLDEVDEWLIHKKKLCPVCKADVTQPPSSHTAPPQTSLSEDEGESDVLYEEESLRSHSPVSSTPTESTPLLHTS